VRAVGGHAISREFSNAGERSKIRGKNLEKIIGSSTPLSNRVKILLKLSALFKRTTVGVMDADELGLCH
jgi:hypothetical protein